MSSPFDIFGLGADPDKPEEQSAAGFITAFAKTVLRQGRNLRRGWFRAAP